MVHEVLKIFHHDLLKHVQVRNHDMRFLSNIETIEKVAFTSITP